MPVHPFPTRVPSVDGTRSVSAPTTWSPRVRRRRERTLIALPWVHSTATIGAIRTDDRRAA